MSKSYIMFPHKTQNAWEMRTTRNYFKKNNLKQNKELIK